LLGVNKSDVIVQLLTVNVCCFGRRHFAVVCWGWEQELKLLNCYIIVTSVSASDTNHRPVQDMSILTFAIKYFCYPVDTIILEIVEGTVLQLTVGCIVLMMIVNITIDETKVT
jgi:hypothetical protein